MLDTKRTAEAPQALLSMEQHIATILLNRPSKRNSISLEMLDEIEQALDQIAESDCRVLVIRGAGGNFCTGADLKYVTELLEKRPSAFAEDFIPRVQGTMNRIEDLPIPVIAAVEGYCIAGGFELLLACDIVMAARSAQLGDGHSIYGFLPGSGGAYRLTRKTGITRAKYIAFTGDMFSADEMHSLGVVTQVCDDEALGQDIDTLAAKLASRSPIGLKRMKELIHASATSDRATGLMSERVASAAHVNTFDMSEGLKAFAARRAPEFKGR